MAQSALDQISLRGRLSRLFHSFGGLGDKLPRLMAEFQDFNVVFFDGRVFIVPHCAGEFVPGKDLEGYHSIDELYAAIPHILERGEVSLPLFNIIGDGIRQCHCYMTTGDTEPRLLFDLMGYNFVLSQGKIFLDRRPDAPFARDPERRGYNSVIEACAALFDSIDHFDFPRVLAFEHTITKHEGGAYVAISHASPDAPAIRHEYFQAIMRDLRQKRDDVLEIYIHIGMAKTATTFLQRHVLPDIPRVHFVKWDTYFFAHEFQRLKYGNPLTYLDEMKRGFDAYADSFDEAKIIISDEAILAIDNRAKAIGSSLIGLHLLFPRARILLVLREQADHLRSLYVQGLRSGLNRTAVNFVRYQKTDRQFLKFDVDVNSNHIDMKFFELTDLVRLWRAQFQHVHILLFEQLRHTPEIFAAGLSEWLGETVCLKQKSDIRENVGLGLVGVYIFKIFNFLTAGREWVWHQSRIGRWDRFVRWLDARWYIHHNPFPAWLEGEIRKRFSVSNQDLAALIGINLQLYWNKTRQMQRRDSQ